MQIRPFGPDDGAAVDAHVEVVNAARALDAPWLPPVTRHEVAGELRFGWDLEPPTAYLACADGVPVATGGLHTSERDNRHLAWLEVQVHPGHRRRGHGSALLAALTEAARERGRTTLGTDGWDAEAPRAFAARHGFEEVAVQVQRRQLLGELDWEALDRRYAAALPHAAAYTLERRAGRSPDGELEPLARLTAAINDAPTDGLDVEDEVYTAERIRDYETAQLARGHEIHRVLARHRESGALAGHTVVVVDGERPQLGEQHDTAVAAGHRGHRLGLLLKLEMVRWLREARPGLVQVDTWNAESNDHMVGVNVELGYRIVGRELDFQRRLG
ncbi:GNAT family N-acetyltransferase [Nocardioides ferulae]|uniref:GNAT family N-acetyltransferase n=1 Tax=Nocardioides ferulae TaxID=2340821 RepID=UPI000EAF6F12|nr:GNAT family N-acetyltransferase [Nocardioides ferulae]